MAHISSIGAGMFSDMSVAKALPAAINALDLNDSAALMGEFGANEYDRLKNVREFPSLGTPPNVVNVPVFGQAQSQQVQGQSDAPSMELQINYVPADWADGTTLGDYVGDGKIHLFRFTLLNAEPAGYDSTVGADQLGSVENSQYFFIGKIEALQVNPQLTDANTATLTLTVQSDFYGAHTTNAA